MGYSDKIKRQYYSQRSRIKRFIREKEKLGYIFPDDVLPQIPKNITEASVRRLKKLDAKHLYEKSYYQTNILGEVITGKEYNILQRKKKLAEQEFKKANKAIKNFLPESELRDFYTKAGGVHDRYSVLADKESSINPDMQDYAANTEREIKRLELGTSVRRAALDDIKSERRKEEKERVNKIKEEQEIRDLIERAKKLKDDIADYEEKYGKLDDSIYTDNYFITEDNEQPKQKDNSNFSKLVDEFSDEVDEEFSVDYNYDNLPLEDEVIYDNLDDIFSRVDDSYLDKLIEKINKYIPKAKWSANFTSIKQGDVDKATRIISNAQSQIGRDLVAENAKNHSEALGYLINEILYGSGSSEYDFKSGRSHVQSCLTQFTNLLLGRSMTYEESKDFTEMDEENDYE